MRNRKELTLIRFDIIMDLKNLYDAIKDEMVKEKALELIEIDADHKYRNKSAYLWNIRKK